MKVEYVIPVIFGIFAIIMGIGSYKSKKTLSRFPFGKHRYLVGAEAEFAGIFSIVVGIIALLIPALYLLGTIKR